MTNNGNGDWSNWKNYVIDKIEKIESKIEKASDEHHKFQIDIHEKINKVVKPLEKDITMLKTKSAIIGAIAGTIGSIILSLVLKGLLG